MKSFFILDQDADFDEFKEWLGCYYRSEKSLEAWYFHFMGMLLGIIDACVGNSRKLEGVRYVHQRHHRFLKTKNGECFVKRLTIRWGYEEEFDERCAKHGG